MHFSSLPCTTYPTLLIVLDLLTQVITILCKSRDSSVGIATGYWLYDRNSRVRFLVRAGNFSLHHRVQNGTGAHPASYPMDTGGCFPGIKRPACQGNQSPPSSAEVKNAWSCTSTLHSTSSWRGA
jgi:hypothetical protein